MQNIAQKIVVLGTGGTIAGTAPKGAPDSAYTAAQIGVAQLLAAVPALASEPIECEQVAQIDSKDMTFDVWIALAQRVEHHLSRDDVAGIVITHGTDTLEETAYFLQRVVAPKKPVVLTAAMRPATSTEADGPRNILDSVRVAQHAECTRVVVVLAGQVHDSRNVRKAHTSRLDAFSSGDEGLLALVEGGQVRSLTPWPTSDPAIGLHKLPKNGADWPWVEIVTSDAGATGAAVNALCAAGVNGIVVAATGSGTVHSELEAALLNAQSAGVRVTRSTRCGNGRVRSKPQDTLAAADDLTPVKARIALILDLLGA